MLPQDLDTLAVSTNNRMLQRCVEDALTSFETKIDPIITKELRNDGGVVLGYCPVQCGVVAAALNI